MLLALLVPLQCVAPLLHAHALDDPSSAVSRSVHVPGLEALDRSRAAGPKLRERSFPLVEEADLSRRDVADWALVPELLQVLAPLVFADDPVGHSRSKVCTSVASSPPPPSRAPPSLQQS